MHLDPLGDANDEPSSPRDLGHRSAELGLRARQIGLALGAVLIVAGIVLAFHPRPGVSGISGPGSLLSAGLMLIFFAGRTSTEGLALHRDGT